MEQNSKSKTLICVLLLIPLVFIVYFAVIYSSNNIDPSDIASVTLEFSDGRKTELTDTDGISLYVNAIMDATEISSPLRAVTDTDGVKILCDRKDKILEYTLYPELSLNGCMISKGDGKYYVLTSDSAKALLSRSEYSYLYAARFTQPLLLSTGGSVTRIMPSTYEWKYKRISGDFTEYTDSEVYDGVTVYSMYSDRENSLAFDNPPTNVTVQLTDESGLPIAENDVSKLIFARDTLMNVRVTAEWVHSSDSQFYGKAVYSFRALYDIPSTLSLSSNTVTAGSSVAVNVRHLNDTENVTVSAAISASPLAFSENSGYKTALLAVDIETQPGEYELVFTIGDNTFAEKLTVTAPDRDFHRVSISSENYNRLLGDPAKNELEALIKSLNSDVSKTAYADPGAALRKPTDTGTLEVTYGTQILMNLDSSTDSVACTAIGDTYKCVDGAKVYAAKAGKVVYSGMTLMLGNVVVIDHGCGLQTWYYGLKSTERSVGSELKQGDVVGFAGTNEYVSAPRLCFAVSVCGMFTKPLY